MLGRGDNKFGDQHFILLCHSSMKCGSYLSTLFILYHSPHIGCGVVAHGSSRVDDKKIFVNEMLASAMVVGGCW